MKPNSSGLCAEVGLYAWATAWGIQWFFVLGIENSKPEGNHGNRGFASLYTEVFWHVNIFFEKNMCHSYILTSFLVFKAMWCADRRSLVATCRDPGWLNKNVHRWCVMWNHPKKGLKSSNSNLTCNKPLVIRFTWQNWSSTRKWMIKIGWLPISSSMARRSMALMTSWPNIWPAEWGNITIWLSHSAKQTRQSAVSWMPWYLGDVWWWWTADGGNGWFFHVFQRVSTCFTPILKSSSSIGTANDGFTWFNHT